MKRVESVIKSCCCDILSPVIHNTFIMLYCCSSTREILIIINVFHCSNGRLNTDEKSFKLPPRVPNFCCIKNNVIIYENVVEILCVPTLGNLPQQVSSFWPTQGITIDVFDVTWEDSFTSVLVAEYQNVTITFVRIAKSFLEMNWQTTFCLYRIQKPLLRSFGIILHSWFAITGNSFHSAFVSERQLHEYEQDHGVQHYNTYERISPSHYVRWNYYTPGCSYFLLLCN